MTPLSHTKKDNAMAVQEQVKQLTRNVDEWNQWGQKHPDICPDFSYADLRRGGLPTGFFHAAATSQSYQTLKLIISVVKPNCNQM